MSSEADKLCQKLLPDELKMASVELVSYWCDSFGNKSRIDYGTGHEMNFLIFLLCLNKLLLKLDEEHAAVNRSFVTRVFAKYMDVVRKVQLRYCMEPAGTGKALGK